MRAVVLYGHGGLEKLVYEPDYRAPAPGAGDALVRMRACALNYHDLFTRRGMPGIKVPLPLITGNDLAGEIAALGPDVTGFASGERVLVDPVDRRAGGFLGETMDGGLAELVRVPAYMLVKLDPAIDYAEAAALPVAYGTAHRMMVTRGAIKPGETVLILGASGGVGTCCVQLAKLAGATVVACASSEPKLAQLKALGADVCINYMKSDWVAECRRRFGRPRVFARQESGGIDAVVNFNGGDSWTKSLKVLRRGGRLLTCGATSGYDPPEDIRYIWTFELNILGSNGWTREDILALLDLVRTGRLQPVLHPRRFGLAETREAMALLEERAMVGKVIVTP
ncbi:MAG TPA: zinc-binding dehydrogenase [Xanthobacteraceae bacterium]|jgi:alcohol dehydrogenase